MAGCFIKIKGLIKMFYITIAMLIVWLLLYHLCPKSKKMEFFIGNISFAFPLPSHINSFQRNYLQIGDIIPNCGIESPCPENHFAVHLHTGKSITDKPKICIGGKYVIHEKIKNGVRGFNMAVVDPRLREAVAARGFDRNSKEFETFLREEIREGDIVVLLTFDEASSKLTNGIRKHLADLGSGMIQNLQTRDQWFMVSQKGMSGFSPFEGIRPFRRGHYDALDKKLCVPVKIDGLPIIPDPPFQNNLDRLRFCRNHSDMEDFCSPNNVLNELHPGMLSTPKPSGAPFYSSPIAVLASDSLSLLSRTLETLLSQPGVQPRAVTVVYNPLRTGDVPHLCSLFGFGTWPTEETGLEGMLEASARMVSTKFPKAPFVTLVQEGVVFAADFFSYITRALPLLEDSSVIGVSAWNPNGFTGVSGSVELAYRVQPITLIAFTMKNNFGPDWESLLGGCCDQSEGVDWFLSHLEGKDLIIPDVSRCFYVPRFESLRNTSSSLLSLFYRERVTNMESGALLSDPPSLHSSLHDALLSSLLSSNASRSIHMTKDQVTSFSRQGALTALHLYLKERTRRETPTFVLPFIESEPENLAGMKLLCRCFGLAYLQYSMPFGFYKGTLRFSVSGVKFLLLSSVSPFFGGSSYNDTQLILP